MKQPREEIMYNVLLLFFPSQGQGDCKVSDWSLRRTGVRKKEHP